MTRWDEYIAMTEGRELDSLDKVEISMEVEGYFATGPRHLLEPETADVVKLLELIREHYPEEYAAMMDTGNPEALTAKARAKYGRVDDMTDVQEAAGVAVDVTPEIAAQVIVKMAERLAKIDDDMPEQPIRVIAWFLRQAIIESK